MLVVRRRQRTGQRIEVVGFHPLAAHAQRQLQALVVHRQRVGQREAAQFGVRHARHVARQLHVLRRAVDGRVQIRQHRGAIGRNAAEAVAVGADLCAHHVTQRTGLETRAQAGFGGAAVNVEAEALRHRAGIAGRIQYGRVAEQAIDPGAPATDAGEQRELLARRVLDAGQHRLVLGFETLPALRHVAPSVGRRRHGHTGAEERTARRRVDVFPLIDDVQRGAQSVAAVVERQRAHRGGARLLVDAGVAVVHAAVETDADATIRPEAAAQVEVAAVLRVRRRARGEAREVIGAGTLGHDVDGAAHAAGRRHAVEQRGRPLDHLDALGVVDQHAVVRRHAVDTVEGDLARVLVADRKAADEEGVEDVARMAGNADRRVVADNVGHADRLPVFDHADAVARDAEGGVHHVGVAQHAQASAARHLAARLQGRQRMEGFGVGAHAHRVQHRHFATGRRRTRGPPADGVAAPACDGLEPGIGQQRLQRALDRVVALQPARTHAGQLCRLVGHVDAGDARVAVERRGQRSGRQAEMQHAGRRRRGSLLRTDSMRQCGRRHGQAQQGDTQRGSERLQRGMRACRRRVSGKRSIHDGVRVRLEEAPPKRAPSLQRPDETAHPLTSVENFLRGRVQPARSASTMTQ